jgi:hypothetical protein
VEDGVSRRSEGRQRRHPNEDVTGFVWIELICAVCDSTGVHRRLALYLRDAHDPRGELERAWRAGGRARTPQLVTAADGREFVVLHCDVHPVRLVLQQQIEAWVVGLDPDGDRVVAVPV